MIRHARLHRDRTGGARLKLFLVLILVAGGLGGWYFFLRKPATKPIVKEEPKIPCRSDDKVLCTFITSWEAPTKYRFTVNETSSGSTATSVYEYDFGEPAKIHATLADGQETISIGNTLYTKEGDSWIKQTVGPAESTDAPKSNTGEDRLTAKDIAPIKPDHYEKVGKEDCGKHTCYKYQVFDPENPDTLEFIWFDDKDYQLRMLRFETAGVISEQTFEYVSVDIAEPSPVQDAS